MSFARISLRRCGVFCVLLLAVLVVAGFSTSQAQLPDLIVEVADTTADAGELNSVISVFMTNYQDTVCGFNLWLQLDRPDIMIFQGDTTLVTDTIYECTQYDQDSVCIDSVISDTNTYEAVIGNFDTTNTLISGWELVDARSLSGVGIDLNIAALADDPFNTTTTPGIPPQTDGLLIKLLADVLDVPDSTTDRKVNILIQHEFIDHFNFSRCDGTSIGITTREVEDTTFWRCTQWGGSTCLQWEKVSTAPYDSISVDTVQQPIVDTSKAILIDGSLRVNPPYVCGNINGSDPPDINIGDLVYLVAFMFKEGPEPIPVEAGEVNCSDPVNINIADLVYMVAYMFKEGPAPCANCL